MGGMLSKEDGHRLLGSPMLFIVLHNVTILSVCYFCWLGGHI